LDNWARRRDSSGAWGNSTSALENCETSAIGRALANAGYATKGKRASREEMGKVVKSEDLTKLKEETKAKMAQSSGEYIPVVREDDPWTVKSAPQAATIQEAVAMVKRLSVVRPRGIFLDVLMARCIGKLVQRRPVSHGGTLNVWLLLMVK